MALTPRQRLAAIAYGTFFCLVLPLVLVRWAAATSDVIDLPPYGTPAGGVVLIAGGTTLMALGFLALWRRGGGLPMNAFPPPTLVTTGVYRWLPHPIYLGFALAALGLAMAFQSSSGLWLVAPTVMLGCAALVAGFERPDLERRFPHAAREYLWLPPAHDGPPPGMARIRCYLFLLVPWVAIYEILVWSGMPKDSLTLALPFEHSIPVLAWTEPVYMSTYIVVGLTPLLARTSRSLRQFMLRSWLAMAICFSLYLTFPIVAPHKPFIADGFWAKALMFERGADPPLNAFPSFHTIWAFLATALLGTGNSKFAWLWRLWAAGVAVSCVTTGMHWIADVVAGGLLSVALIRIQPIWRFLLRLCERIANSWQEWRIGPVRIINHGLYAGLAAGTALLIVGTLIGPGHAKAILVTAFAGLVGAAVWAQWVEGSPHLLRPFGFYGGLIGVGLACIAAPLFDTPAMLIGAAWCVAAPWMQAIGRLRCLVQGCCHGRCCSDAAGIRYRHPNSRVARIDALRGQPVYPTPLYSILWNLFVAVVLARMWCAGCELHLIVGVFGIVSGMGRFVEEAYRGEPQTPVFARLRLYQWLAAATVVAGGIFTSLPLHAAAPMLVPNLDAIVLAAIFGILAAAALGVDAPASNRRFARLA